jgi:hypothetical protein
MVALPSRSSLRKRPALARTEGFVLSRSAQSVVKDFEQSHLIPPKMQTKLEIRRQAELFPSSGFFQPRKVVLFCTIVRVAAE